MLEQALMKIPAEYREPLVMYYRQEKSTREVAVGLELKESTVRTRLHRARKMLREEMAARLERTLERTAPRCERDGDAHDGCRRDERGSIASRLSRKRRCQSQIPEWRPGR